MQHPPAVAYVSSFQIKDNIIQYRFMVGKQIANTVTRRFFFRRTKDPEPYLPLMTRHGCEPRLRCQTLFYIQ